MLGDSDHPRIETLEEQLLEGFAYPALISHFTLTVAVRPKRD